MSGRNVVFDPAAVLIDQAGPIAVDLNRSDDQAPFKAGVEVGEDFDCVTAGRRGSVNECLDLRNVELKDGQPLRLVVINAHTRIGVVSVTWISMVPVAWIRVVVIFKDVTDWLELEFGKKGFD